MAHNETRTYLATPEEVVGAVKDSLNKLGWKLKSEDQAERTLVASTKVSMRSWGEHVEARVGPAESGSTLNLSVSLRFGLVGWGAQKLTADRLFAEIESTLDSGHL